MSFHGKKWTICGIPTGLVLRNGTSGYSIVFERCFASIEQIEGIDWEKPEIVELKGEPCPLPDGYGFDVQIIAYDDGIKAYRVTVTPAKPYLGDVSAYVAELKDKQKEIEDKQKELGERESTISALNDEINTLNNELAEADATVEELYEQLSTNTGSEMDSEEGGDQ